MLASARTPVNKGFLVINGALEGQGHPPRVLVYITAQTAQPPKSATHQQ